MMRLTRQHPQRDTHPPARDGGPGATHDGLHEPEWRRAAQAAVRQDPPRHPGRGTDAAWDEVADGSDPVRPDPAEAAFRRGGPRSDTAHGGGYRADGRRRDGSFGDGSFRDGPFGDGPFGDGSFSGGSTGVAPQAEGSRDSRSRDNGSWGDRAHAAPRRDAGIEAGRDDPLPVGDRLGHAVLGAGWVAGDLSSLDEAIHPAACLRTGLAVTRGPGAIMAAALADLGSFDQLAYFAENTLASSTLAADLCPQALAAMDMDHAPADGAILSMRGSLTGRAATGTAPGVAPMGARDIRQRIMADLWCGHGQVLDGWILRDTGGALAQAGGPHPADWARGRLRAAGGPDRMPPPLTPDTDPDGPYVARSPRSRRCDWGEALADRLRRIMDGDLATLDRGSDPACAHVLPGGVAGLGAVPARRFWAGLRAALPSAAFRIEHRHGAAPPHTAPQAAVRWSLYGRHDGPGRFGAPTGCFLHVPGMTQVEFGPRGVRRDWTVIDDCAVWTQIVMATGQA